MNQKFNDLSEILKKMKGKRLISLMFNQACINPDEIISIGPFVLLFDDESKHFYLTIESKGKETDLLPSSGMISASLIELPKKRLVDKMRDGIGLDYGGVTDFKVDYKYSRTMNFMKEVSINIYHEIRNLKVIDPDIGEDYLESKGYDMFLNIDEFMIESISMFFNNGDRINIISNEKTSVIKVINADCKDESVNFLYMNVNGYDKEIVPVRL